MKRFMMCMILTALMTGLCACGAGSYASAPGSGNASAHVNASATHAYTGTPGSFAGKKMSYTQAEYDFITALKLDGYESMSVEEYNKKVLDWTNEETYHKTEDILRKVFYALPEDDPNRDFIRMTLYNTWEECSNLHYNACHRQTPTYSGSALRETYGDVYGDPLLLTGAYVEFCFDYQVTDGKTITIAKRDSELKNIETQMQKFLDQCSETDLKDEKSMEKKLNAQLEKLLKVQSDGMTFGSGFDVDYWWEQPYQYEGSLGNNITEASSALENGYNPDTETYTKEQYDSVISALKPSGYESMSISDFNRMVYNTLYGMDASEDLSYAYEMVAMYIKDNDANADFLRKTVPRSLNEYQAKVREVSSGKTVDPEHSDELNISHKEDVFGNKVETGVCYTDYSFTYRITAPDKLTVNDRDTFLNNVTDAIRKSLDSLAADKLPDKEQVKTAIEAAGKTVSNDNIQFTGSSIEYFEAVPYN